MLLKSIKSDFLLDKSITYLNHGSFGACPIPIFEDYQEWQRKLETAPVQFITKHSNDYLQIAKNALATFINCDKDDFIYTVNPSTALNLVIKNLALQEGDEVLTTNQEYGAMDRTWRYYCKKAGAIYKQQSITLPIVSKADFIEEFFKGITSKTKIIFISHITSSSALIFPVKEICERAKKLGLITIIDGAHVPGHLPLNLQQIEADIYVGACHKWLLTPKGCSFLYVKKEFQHLLDPLVISWGYESENPSHSTFLDYNEYQGTRDISAFLTLPKALNYLTENNWTKRSEACRVLIQKNYPLLCDLLQTAPICPVSDEFLGQMCSIPIYPKNALVLKEKLYHDFKIEIPITNYQQKYFLRVSMQVYNNQEDINKLIDAISKLKQQGFFLFFNNHTA